MSDLIEIDGSYGEGGGQILRTAMPLSALLERPLRVHDIRANRPKPGLKMQHLVGVKAVRDLSNGELEGARLGSSDIKFTPGKLRGGNFILNIQTAGSITLLLQSVMPMIPFLPEPVSARVQGGTDVNWSPPIDFVLHVLNPVIDKMGYKTTMKLIRRGYFPEGGGVITGKGSPVKHLKGINLTEFEDIDYVEGVSHCLNLPDDVAREMAAVARHELTKIGYPDVGIEVDAKKLPSKNRGAGITLWGVSEDPLSRIGASAIMQKKTQTGEELGRQAAKDLVAYIDKGVPVDAHMQDQLLVYAALAKGKTKFTTTTLTEHSTTTIKVLEEMVDVKFRLESEKDKVTVSVNGIGLENKFLK